LLREYVDIDIFSLYEESLRVFLIIFECTLEILLGLGLVAESPVDDSTNQPELPSILLGDCLEDIVQLCKSLLVVLGQDEAEHGVEGELVDIERAEANIREICLAASIAGILIVIIHTIDVACASGRLIAIIVKVCIWKLVLGIQHLVLVHDA